MTYISWSSDFDISWRLFDGGISYYVIMRHCDTTLTSTLIYVTVIYISRSSDLSYLEDYLMAIHLNSDNATGRPSLWPQNEYRSAWPIFHCPVMSSYVLKIISLLNVILRIMSQSDAIFDLKINVGHSALYVMIRSFYLISWIRFDGWTSYFDPTFDR